VSVTTSLDVTGSVVDAVGDVVVSVSEIAGTEGS